MLYLSQFARRLLIACCFCSGLTLSVRGVTIDPGCAAWDPKINEALNEAVSIANYGTTRWQGRPLPRPGTLLQDMLGAPNEDDETTLNFASGTSALVSGMLLQCILN